MFVSIEWKKSNFFFLNKDKISDKIKSEANSARKKQRFGSGLEIQIRTDPGWRSLRTITKRVIY